jgi:hypothetical protein
MSGKVLMKRRGIFRSNLDRSIQIGWLSPTPWDRKRGALVLGLGYSNSDGVSTYGTGTTRRNTLLTFGSGDSQGWAGNGGVVETKMCVSERPLW